MTWNRWKFIHLNCGWKIKWMHTNQQTTLNEDYLRFWKFGRNRTLQINHILLIHFFGLSFISRLVGLMGDKANFSGTCKSNLNSVFNLINLQLKTLIKEKTNRTTLAMNTGLALIGFNLKPADPVSHNWYVQWLANVDPRFWLTASVMI